MFSIQRRTFRFEGRARACLLLLAALFALAALAGSSSRTASAGDELKTVIVQLKGDPVVVARHRAESEGRDFDALAYRQQVIAEQDAFLSRAAAAGIAYTVAGVNAPNGEVVAPIQFRFNYVYNGVTLVAPEAAVPALERLEGVAAVHEATPFWPNLDHALDYSRVPAVYGRPPRLTQYDELNTGGLHGEGTYIAVIDSGIDWSHPMFGGDPTPPRFGVAPAAGNTNQKVVYYMNFTAGAVTDDYGHGTHVAGIAAGYLGQAPGPDGLPLTADDVRIHGVAPQAKLMGYKVLAPHGSGLAPQIIMAVEDAVQPFTLTGQPKPVAHVINLSLGDTSNDPGGATAVACDNATLAGVTVVASAGNSGRSVPTNPTGEATLGAPSTGRRVIAVGANNDKIAGGDAWSVDVLAASAVDPNRTGGVTPARHLAKAEGFDRLRLYPMSGAEPPNADAVAQRYVLVTTPQTPAGFLGASGRIALVKNTSGVTSGAFVQTANSAAAAGAIGVILISTTTNPGAVASTIPAAVILPEDGEKLVDAMRPNDDDTVDPPAGTVSELPIRLNPNLADVMLMADFSSKGPVNGFGQVKPDVTAPGVNILSATVKAGGVRVAYTVSVPPGVGYSYMMNPTGYVSTSGTSMSGPLTAGVAALIKQKHPDWTPAMIRAALINTATNLRMPDGTPLPDGANTINQQGGGLIDAAAAVNTKALMGTGAPGPWGSPTARTHGLLASASPGNPDFLASHSFGAVPVAGVEGTAALAHTVNIHDVTGGGGAGTYRLSSSNVRGVDGTNFQVQLTDAAGGPVSEVEVPAGGSASFKVAITADGESLANPSQVEWYVTAERVDGGQRLRMPFYFRAVAPTVAMAAPAMGDVTGNEVADNPPVDINGAYRLAFSKPATGAQASKLRVQESADGGATWATLGEVDASQTTFDVAGRGNGTFQYRTVALYPVQYGLLAGPASAARSVRVDRRLEADVSSMVELVNQSIVFGAGFTELTSALRNTSAGTTVYPPASIQITSISSKSGRVRVTNADNGGNGQSAPAAFDYSTQLAGGDLTPGESSGTRVLRFGNPNTELFTFTAVVRAHLPDPAFAQGGAGVTAASGQTAGDGGGSGAQQGTALGGALSGAPTTLTFTVNPLTRTVSLVR